MKKKSNGLLLIVGGLLLIAAAFSITGMNLRENKLAGIRAKTALEILIKDLPNGEDQPVEGEVYPDYVLNPEMPMPVKRVGGYDYIGILSIPALSLELPVMDTWDYDRLRVSPCRYSGSAYTNDLTIAAHNYTSHFGRLSSLSLGDAVSLTDMDGNVFTYRVAEITTLRPFETREMTEGEWDMTLFTCTVGGRMRVTVRCEKVVDTELVGADSEAAHIE